MRQNNHLTVGAAAVETGCRPQIRITPLGDDGKPNIDGGNGECADHVVVFYGDTLGYSGFRCTRFRCVGFQSRSLSRLGKCRVLPVRILSSPLRHGFIQQSGKIGGLFGSLGRYPAVVPIEGCSRKDAAAAQNDQEKSAFTTFHASSCGWRQHPPQSVRRLPTAAPGSATEPDRSGGQPAVLRCLEHQNRYLPWLSCQSCW